jgi:hypothetical protein
MESSGPERLEGVFVQFLALTHLNFRGNNIRTDGAKSLAGVTEC